MLKILFSFILIFTSYQSKAYFSELYAFSALGQAVHPNEASSPDMFAHALGATIAFDVIAGVHLGVSGEYRFYNQSSDVEDPFGNRTGTRLALSPTIAYSFNTIVLKYIYQMYGDYELSNETSGGDKVTYSDVSGHTFSASMPVSGSLRLGLFYELETFDTVTNGSTETDLAENENQLEFNKYGLILSMIY